MRVVLLLFGLCIAHLGVTLFLQTELGSDPFNVFVQGLFRALPWPAWAAMTHGRVHLLVSLLILLVLLMADRSYVGVGTVLCMALGGPIIDVYTLWLAPVIHGGLPLLWRLGLLVIQININRLQISLGKTSLLTTRIISDYLLISLDSLRILISLIIEQTYFVSRSTGHIAFREFLQQNIETINSIRMILHLNKSTALLIQSIIQILRLGIIRYQTV